MTRGTQTKKQFVSTLVQVGARTRKPLGFTTPFAKHPPPLADDAFHHHLPPISICRRQPLRQPLHAIRQQGSSRALARIAPYFLVVEQKDGTNPLCGR